MGKNVLCILVKYQLHSFLLELFNPSNSGPSALTLGVLCKRRMKFGPPMNLMLMDDFTSKVFCKQLVIAWNTSAMNILQTPIFKI